MLAGGGFTVRFNGLQQFATVRACAFPCRNRAAHLFRRASAIHVLRLWTLHENSSGGFFPRSSDCAQVRCSWADRIRPFSG